MKANKNTDADKASFIYQSAKGEKICGDPDSVIKFKRERDIFKITFIILGTLCSILGYYLKSRFFP